MPKATLRSIFETHQGKVSDKWASYLDVYGDLFAGLREKKINLLEIGVQNGGSLEIWAKYFKNATKLIGCDVDPRCASLHWEDPRIIVVIGSSSDSSTAQAIFEIETDFDLIIDDGSHKSSDVICSFARYFPQLRDGGIYVVEDLHCSYWASWDGGLFNRFSSMAFLKSLADVINAEHLQQHPSQLLSEFGTKYNIQLSDELLAEIHSITFSNSICVITKRTSQHNLLGTRIIAGNECQVDPSIGAAKNDSAMLDGGHLRNNQLHIDGLYPSWEKQISKLEQDVAQRDLQIGELNHTLVLSREQVTRLEQDVAQRDLQIGELNHTLVLSREQVIRLEQDVAQQEEQKTKINQTLARYQESIRLLAQSSEILISQMSD